MRGSHLPSTFYAHYRGRQSVQLRMRYELIMGVQARYAADAASAATVMPAIGPRRGLNLVRL